MPLSSFVRPWHRILNSTLRKTGTPRIQFAHLECEPLEERNLMTVGGVWSPAVTAPGALGTMMLLPDGTVMAQGGYSGSTWYRLSVDAQGNYSTGSWSGLPSSFMSTDRLYFGSAVLPNGNVFVVGGEYSNGNLPSNDTNLSETFNPLLNAWSTNAPFPQANFGDDPVEVLPNGNVLAGYLFGPQTYIYNPGTNTWSNGPTKVHNDSSDEETWTLLPNGDMLTYDLFSSISSGVFQGEIYNPNTNAWSATKNSLTNPPSQLSNPNIGYELGGAELLPDGRVFQIGANGNTAFYDYRTNTWSAGPQIRNAANQLFGADDAPAAILPGGQVIFGADAGPISGTFHPPTQLFEFDPTTNKISQLTLPTALQTTLNGEGSYVTRMLILPTGQLALSDATSTLWLFTPDPTDPSNYPADAWLPTISGVSYNNSTQQFTLSGTQLTGLSEGSSYGDDVLSASNYPIVQLQDLNGNVYNAFTSGWTPGVSAAGTTTPQTVNFILPAGVAAGDYFLTVTTNGIASYPIWFNVSAAEQTTQSPDLVVTSGSQYTQSYDYFYYNNYNNYYYPFYSNTSNSLSDNAGQVDSGNYANSSYANVYGGAFAAQQLSYYNYTGISTSANASANPVINGNYAYTYGYSSDSLNFSLAQEAIVTFAYTTGAYAATSGTSDASAYGYGQVYNNDTGYYYYAYSSSNASNGGGPFDFYFSGSFSIDLPAGSYTLYGYSSVYADAYTGASSLASAYNAVALTNINTVLGPSSVEPDSSAPGGSGTLPPASGGGVPPVPTSTAGGAIGAATSPGQLPASVDFLTNPTALNPTAPWVVAPPGVAFQPPAQSAGSPPPHHNLDTLFASLAFANSTHHSHRYDYLSYPDGNEGDSGDFWRPLRR